MAERHGLEYDEHHVFPSSNDGYGVVTLPGQSRRTYTVQQTRCVSMSKSGAGWLDARRAACRPSALRGVSCEPGNEDCGGRRHAHEREQIRERASSTRVGVRHPAPPLDADDIIAG